MKVKELPFKEYYKIKNAFESEIPDWNFYNSWGESELKDLRECFRELSESPRLIGMPDYKKVYDVINRIYLYEPSLQKCEEGGGLVWEEG